MALNGIHLVGPAKILDDCPIAPLIVQQVEGQALHLGTQQVLRSTSGQVFRTFSGIGGQSPRFSMTTSQIAAVLTAIGLKGFVLATGFEVYNTAEDASTRLRGSGAVHQKFKLATGLVIPRSISVDSGGDAKLTFDVIGENAAGTASPLTVTETVSLPASSGVGELFTLGPVKVNGTAVPGVTGLTVDFGIKEKVIQPDSAIWPMHVYVEAIQPKISLKLVDAGAFAAFGPTGLAEAGTTVIYLRKRLLNGTYVADGTAQHIALNVYKGLWLPSDKGGSHPGELNTSVECEPIYDGTHDPLAFNGASAIS